MYCPSPDSPMTVETPVKQAEPLTVIQTRLDLLSITQFFFVDRPQNAHQ